MKSAKTALSHFIEQCSKRTVKGKLFHWKSEKSAEKLLFTFHSFSKSFNEIGSESQDMDSWKSGQIGVALFL